MATKAGGAASARRGSATGAQAPLRKRAGVPASGRGARALDAKGLTKQAAKGVTEGSARGPRRAPAPLSAAAALPAGRADAATVAAASLAGLGYELVDAERGPRGLLRVTLDRLPDRTYADGGDTVTIDDCELVTRQLQHVFEVEGVAYERLEVSSPGLDRPLRTDAHLARHVGESIAVTLKAPLDGRKHFKGVLGRADAGWTLVFDEGRGAQELGFMLDEVREARLVPVIDFKGRKAKVVPPTGPAHETEV